nr:hypothetical protein [Tanacetum cinerariifolium]
MNKAVKVAVQIQSDRLRNEAQAENEEFLKTIDENMQNIIKEEVKEQVKVQVSKILPKIEQTVNEQLKAEVFTRSSNSSKTSYAVADDLLEMELKKILIEKMYGNKSIHQSNKQRNLYKALVEAYESDKIILDTYGDTVMLKRHRDDDADKDEEPSTGSDRGSKRRREGKEPESASAPKEKVTRSAGKSTQGADDQPIAESSQHPEWFSLQKKPPTPDRDWNKTLRLQEAPHSRHMRYVTASGLRKLTNLTVEEHFAFNVSLRMFTRSIVIQRCVEDLQLGVKSYQKKLNLTRPDTYCSDLKRKEAYIAYSNPRGFIYQNKDKHNRLMRIDELHKFNDGTLTDVRTTLDDQDISLIQDVVLREKLLSINRLIANIESLNDNPTLDCVLYSSVSIPTSEESENSLLDNFSPEFETFYNHTEETRSGNTTTHADDSLPEYDSFCFEIEPDQERLINVMKNDISDDSSNDPLLEEADLFLASDNSIPPGIENFGDDSEGDICFLNVLLIDDSVPFPNNESSESDFHNLSFPRSPLESLDVEFDFKPDS